MKSSTETPAVLGPVERQVRPDSEVFGPWSAARLERLQFRPYYVCRQIGISQWEQLQKVGGGIARFETIDEAQHAADAANEVRA